MGVTRWIFIAALLVAGCSSRHSDPPPPAASVVLPQAPPNAVGAMAAGRAPEPGIGPRDPEEPPDEVPVPNLTPPPSAGDDDAGVNL
jgi:hypothetical protein